MNEAVSQDMHSSDRILPSTLEAPAKLTLSLAVTGCSANGLHAIEAEMVSLTLADELTFEAGDGLEVLGELRPSTGESEVPSGSDNLVCRALAAVGRRAGVSLLKRIPSGAGLGGGSSDAAAVLRWAGVVPDNPADPGDPAMQLALRLGSDVPFCLVGGRAVVSGHGEQVKPLQFSPADFLMVTPPFASSTAAVYAAWDALGAPRGRHGNDLEQAALVVNPCLAEWRDAFGGRCGATPRLAGSGSTWFVQVTADMRRTISQATERPLQVHGRSAQIRMVSTRPSLTCPPGAANASP
ncbi:MAG: 4-(cytidine 5'-diphospho)-2-C-methyl-D-erythritol kinase [Actinomycetota bacterium]|nr:4-(cytidine 5'-diphospho)-2-C-methyl-D-erythritol kinase [Actinomycetota bacterium]